MASKLILKTNPVPPRAIVFDTETTGLSPRTGHRIVELAAIELLNGTPSGNEFHAYINPERSVPVEASRVHGLTQGFLRDKPRFRDILPRWLAFIGDDDAPLWAHNASFDERFMRAEQEAAAHACLRTYSCSLRLSRAVYGKGKHSLDVLAERAGARFDGRGAHSALADTRVLGTVLSSLLWPEEARLATSGVAVDTPRDSRPKSKPKPAKASTFKLPDGFSPLVAEDDPRIRRYDDLDLTDMLTSRGKRWSGEEEAALGHTFLDEKREIPDLVAEFGRSPGALLLKLEAIGVVAPGHPYTRR